MSRRHLDGLRSVPIAAALVLSAACSANGNGGQTAAPSTEPPATVMASQVLLLSGRIGADSSVLDPAFLVASRPVVPQAGGGAHRLAGLDSAGTQLFELRFDGAPVADGGSAESHFSFALPLAAAAVERLHRIELHAANGMSTGRTATSSAAELARVLGVKDVVTARRNAAGQVVLNWDATRFPAVMIRDPASGHVLAFGRGGEAMVLTERGELDVVVSDGVRSGNVRVVVR